MSDPLLLALDVGTSSTRAALFDMDATRLARSTAQHAYALRTTAAGAAELDPAALLKAVRDCLAGTMALHHADRALRGRPIAGIGLTCFWHSLIGLDKAGKPLTPIYTWADARCREDAGKLRAEYTERAVHARTGCMLRASFWPAKLLWLKRTQPRLFHKVARWVSPAEWLQIALSGNSACAIGMATGTGLFDPRRLDWDKRLLERCDVTPDLLGTISDEPIETSGALASTYPELKSIPWFPGIGDGAASNLGCGATRPGFSAINVGTSAAVRIMREGKDARAPFGLFCYRVDARRFLIGGAISNAGNLRAWCLRELRVDPENVEKELAKENPPESDLTVVPFWAAERAPTWNEDLRGAILGITQSTTATDLFRAITEATYHRLAQIVELILGKSGTPPKFLVSGGIQNSAASMQRLADVLGVRLYPSTEPEASIRGAAVFALEKLGCQIAPVKLAASIRPRRAASTIYARQRKRQEDAEKLLE